MNRKKLLCWWRRNTKEKTSREKWLWKFSRNMACLIDNFLWELNMGTYFIRRPSYWHVIILLCFVLVLTMFSVFMHLNRFSYYCINNTSGSRQSLFLLWSCSYHLAKIQQCSMNRCDRVRKLRQFIRKTFQNKKFLFAKKS